MQTPLPHTFPNPLQLKAVTISTHSVSLPEKQKGLLPELKISARDKTRHDPSEQKNPQSCPPVTPGYQFLITVIKPSRGVKQRSWPCFWAYLYSVDHSHFIYVISLFSLTGCVVCHCLNPTLNIVFGNASDECESVLALWM